MPRPGILPDRPAPSARDEGELSELDLAGVTAAGARGTLTYPTGELRWSGAAMFA